MYPYMNEDVAFQSLQDVQREMENSRRWANGERPDWYRWVARVPASVARFISGRLAPAPLEPADCDSEEAEAATDAA